MSSLKTFCLPLDSECFLLLFKCLITLCFNLKSVVHFESILVQLYKYETYFKLILKNFFFLPMDVSCPICICWKRYISSTTLFLYLWQKLVCHIRCGFTSGFSVSLIGMSALRSVLPNLTGYVINLKQSDRLTFPHFIIFQNWFSYSSSFSFPYKF